MMPAFRAMTAGIAYAEDPRVPPAVVRQSLDDAWWSGPMLAPSAATLPRGHFLVEPYFYDVSTRVILAGRNTAVTVTPAVAVNFVH